MCLYAFVYGVVACLPCACMHLFMGWSCVCHVRVCICLWCGRVCAMCVYAFVYDVAVCVPCVCMLLFMCGRVFAMCVYGFVYGVVMCVPCACMHLFMVWSCVCHVRACICLLNISKFGDTFLRVFISVAEY